VFVFHHRRQLIVAERTIIATPDAPGAIGPYSQAVRNGPFLFLSGQLGMDPATGALVAGDVADQTKQAMLNVKAVLNAAGVDLQSVVKTTVFLVEMADFNVMNEVYATFFPENPPARSTVAVAQLPRGGRVEIECLAIIP
jgi:2-iminobutanoate/2-iminopropanoate deaminase